MRQKGHDVTTYKDNIIGYALPSQAHQAFDTLHGLLEDLGFTISEAKLLSPSTKVTCLGIQIDTVNSTLSIPPEKLSEIRTKCHKRELQSFLWSLLYVSKCLRVTRAFLNRMLDTLRCNDSRSEIHLDNNFYRNFYDTTPLHHIKYHFELELVFKV